MLTRFISLRIRLLIIFLIFSIIIIVVASIGFWFYNKSSNISTIAVNLESVLVKTFQVIKLEQDFFDYETTNEDFYITGTSNYIKKHKKLAEEVNQNLYALVSFKETRELNLDQNLIETEAKKILHEMQSYENSFDQLVRLTHQLGFKNYGIKGKMAQQLANLEALSPNLSQINFLKLKQYERDYQLLKDLAYAQKLEKLCNEWQNGIALATNLSPPIKVQAQGLLKDYLKTFQEMVNLEQKIGLTNEKGLKQQLRTYADNIAGFTQGFVGRVNRRAESIGNNFEYIFVIMVIATLILSILMSIYFSVIITRPIVRLSKFIHKTVSSNFSENLTFIQNNSKDEVGRLTRNFNQMLQEMRRQLNEIKEQSVALEYQNEELNKVNEQSQASENHLKKLNTVKDKLLTILSHDLRSPFNTIKGFLQVLLHHIEGFSKEEISHFAEDMDKAVQRVIDLLENLLQWSLIQTDDFEFQPEGIDIQAIIDENIALYEKNALEKHITIMTHPFAQTFVEADKNMLNFVLRNLISNAIKFTNANASVEVFVETNPTFTTITVADKGIGIQPDALEKIFSPEIHLSTKGTANEKGTGFGLILSKEFIEKNGGQLEIQSQVDEGTQVKFSLKTANTMEAM
ncbi:MAG TPA: hypothetical protein DCS93_22695 [Microscillaceae bacterium]|nr:hypothetical protein [Microscillaceae bacterium]